MARTRNSGNGRLEEALATLIQNQATFVAELREMAAERRAERRQMEAEMRDMEHRIDARFEKIMAILDSLPEMIRDISNRMGRMGFQPPIGIKIESGRN